MPLGHGRWRSGTIFFFFLPVAFWIVGFWVGVACPKTRHIRGFFKEGLTGLLVCTKRGMTIPLSTQRLLPYGGRCHSLESCSNRFSPFINTVQPLWPYLLDSKIAHQFNSIQVVYAHTRAFEKNPFHVAKQAFWNQLIGWLSEFNSLF